MIRIVVVDDHEPIRIETVKHLTVGGLINVIAEAGTSDEAWRISQQLLPDIVLLDLHLPGLLSTFDLVKRLSRLRNVKVAVFASESKAVQAQELLEAGASAYILKDDAPALIRMALLMVSRGSTNIISPSLPRYLISLTSGEKQLLKEITKRGKIEKAAQRLEISPKQLGEAMAQLASKLDLEDPDKLIRWAKKHGF